MWCLCEKRLSADIYYSARESQDLFVVPWLITGFINFHDITFMTPGWKQKADFKQAILTGVLKKDKRLRRKKKWNILYVYKKLSTFFSLRSFRTHYKKAFKNGLQHNLGQYQVQCLILAKYWTGNWTIWLADFSYWPFEPLETYKLLNL